MKNIILINLFILFFVNISTSHAAKFPNIPKGINTENYCDNKGGAFGHVIVVIDLTTNLDKTRIEFIKNQVFSKEFYLKYNPFTKFSYFFHFLFLFGVRRNIAGFTKRCAFSF